MEEEQKLNESQKPKLGIFGVISSVIFRLRCVHVYEYKGTKQYHHREKDANGLYASSIDIIKCMFCGKIREQANFKEDKAESDLFFKRLDEIRNRVEK